MEHNSTPRSSSEKSSGANGSLAQMSPQDYRNYPRIKSALATHAEAALGKLYAQIAANPHTAALLPTPEIRAHAAGAQARHWQALFSGPFDAAAVERSEVIGRVHATIGLTPSYYISGYAVMLEEVITRMLTRGLRNRLLGAGNAGLVATLVKTALLDMQSALHAYFRGEEQARTAAINALGKALAAVAEGDLRSDLKDLPKAFEQVAQDFHGMRYQVSTMVWQMSDAAQNVETGACEISAAANDLANRTERQAAAIARTSDVVREVTAAIATTAESAKQVNTSVAQVDINAKAGGKIVDDAVVAMDKIKHSSEEIAQITDVIEAIAFQTNLLALNAGVEAARAGDAGRGFAVVASEVRALAHRTTESAKNIKDLITKSAGDVAEGVDLVGRTGEALNQIIQKVSETTSQASEIASFAETQAESMREVSAEIQQMDLNTQQNAAMVEQSNAAARGLSEQAATMARIVGQFQLEQRTKLRSGGTHGDMQARKVA